jgi:hypothetical protein
MVTDYDSSSFEEVCALADAEGARRSEPDEVARLAKLSTPTASTPTCGRNANVSGATTLPGRPGAPCGCGLVIYPRRPMIACGARIRAGEFTDDLTWLFDEPVPAA